MLCYTRPMDIDRDLLEDAAGLLVPARRWALELSDRQESRLGMAATTMAVTHAMRSAYGALITRHCPELKLVRDHFDFGKVELVSERTGTHWVLRSAKMMGREIRRDFVDEALPGFSSDEDLIGLLFYRVTGGSVVVTAAMAVAVESSGDVQRYDLRSEIEAIGEFGTASGSATGEGQIDVDLGDSELDDGDGFEQGADDMFDDIDPDEDWSGEVGE